MANRILPLTLCLLVVLLLAGCGGDNAGPTASVSAHHNTSLMHTRSLAQDFTQWDEAPTNPVVGPSVDAAFPCVIYQSGKYLMWTDRENGGGVVLRTSSDGKIWSSPAPCGGLKGGARHARMVFNADLGQFETWYFDNTNDFAFNSWFHAVSTDGVTWTNNTVCASAAAPHRTVFTAWNGNVGSEGPAQVFYNGGAATQLDYTNIWANRYVLYYHLYKSSKNGVGVAVSNDGLNWAAPTEGQMVVAPTAGAWDSVAATFGSIIREGGQMHMYYSGGRSYMFGGEGVGYASSSDGLNWTKAPTPLFTRNDNIAWRSFYIGPPAALMADGERTLFLYAYDGYGGYSVGLAKPDLTPPIIALNAANPAVLWPASGNDIAVTFTGSVVDNKSGVAQATLKVEDEYGVQSQTIDLTSALAADGSFSQTIPLNAGRHADDVDGHTYVVTLSAVDNKQNAAQPVSVTVLVPHDRNDANPADGPGNGTGNGNGYGIGNGTANGQTK